jgi:hypothetical protein
MLAGDGLAGETLVDLRRSLGWPPVSMTRERDARSTCSTTRDEMGDPRVVQLRSSTRAETELIGCVHIDPADLPDADAEISWWVRDEYVGTEVEAALDTLVPRWIAADWPLQRPRFGPPLRGLA